MMLRLRVSEDGAGERYSFRPSVVATMDMMMNFPSPSFKNVHWAPQGISNSTRLSNSNTHLLIPFIGYRKSSHLTSIGL